MLNFVAFRGPFSFGSLSLNLYTLLYYILCYTIYYPVLNCCTKLYHYIVLYHVNVTLTCFIILLLHLYISTDDTKYHYYLIISYISLVFTVYICTYLYFLLLLC